MAKGTPLSLEHRAKIKATWDAKRQANGGALTRPVCPEALVKAAETTIAKYSSPPPQLSHVERAILTAIARHTAGEVLEGHVLSLVVFPPALTDHAQFRCSCGVIFEVSGLEAAAYVDRFDR